MAEVMESEGDGGHSSGPFGYNASHLHHAIPYNNTPQHLNRPSILDADEVQLMANFFSDPDGPALAEDEMPSIANGDFNFSMGDKVDGSSFNNAFTFNQHNATVDPASTMATFTEPQYQTRSADPRYFQSLSHPRHMPFDNEDVSGANDLLTLRGSQGTSHMMDNGAMNAASWGNMVAQPNPFAVPVSENNSRMTSRSSSDSAFVNGFPAGQPPFMTQGPMQDMQSQVAQYQQQNSGLSHSGQQFNNLDTNNHHFSGPHSAHNNSLQYPGRVPQPHFGSDTQLRGPYSYAAENYAQVPFDKERNLMHVPLAHQAAFHRNGGSHATQDMSHPSMRAFQSTNTPRDAHTFQSAMASSVGMGGLPVTQSSKSNGKQRVPQWAAMNHRASFNDEGGDREDDGSQRPRKRRKSQAQRDEDDDYRPEPHVEGTVPKRGPKVPKAEVPSDEEDYDRFATPRNPPAYRRKSSGTAHFGHASSSNSPGDALSPTGEGSSLKKRTGVGKARQNLSEDQKRANHILSEQKRRNVIKESYKELDTLVPGLGTGKAGVPRAQQIKETILYLESLVQGNDTIEEQLSKFKVMPRRDQDDQDDEDGYDGAGAAQGGMSSY